jgi:hypothetical protein
MQAHNTNPDSSLEETQGKDNKKQVIISPGDAANFNVKLAGNGRAEATESKGYSQPFKEADNNAATLDFFEYLRITDTTPIEPPVAIIKINGETISTRDNITTISGASKSGKSAFTGVLIAGAISEDGVINDPLESVFVAANRERHAVLHIDTEQARHKHQYNLKSILKRGCMITCPDYYLSYNIRQLDITEYAEITTKICEAAKGQFGGIHLMVIDGIADYISDVNDPVQSNGIIKYFEELAIKYSTPIIVIVHTNPGSDKERGHLGSQCQRKSESILSIKSEGDISYLEPKYLRNAGKGNIPLIQFMYSKEKGYHVGCGIRVDEQGSKDDTRRQALETLAQKVFAPPKSYQYKDAINELMKATSKSIGIAKGKFKEMGVYQMIIQGADKNWRLNLQSDTENEEEENEVVQ